MPQTEHESYWASSVLRDPGQYDGRIRGRKFDPRGFYTTFRGPVQTAKQGGGANSGTTGDVNILQFQCPAVFLEHCILGAGQTIKVPVPGTLGGMNVAQDLTDNEGCELTNGIIAGGPSAFKIGTDPAFFLKLKFNIPDVSGSDQIFVGFRKAQAYDTALANYTDFAVIGNLSGDIKLKTNLNNGGVTTTDTTEDWADGATHTLEVYVSAAGVVTYKIDGHAPAATAAFTFDDTDVVVPFFWFLHDSDIAQATELLEWEVAFQ